MILLIAIAGAALVFLGMVVTAVFWMPTLMKGVGALASLTGPSATVAHANIQKNPRRSNRCRSAHRCHLGLHHRNRCR